MVAARAVDDRLAVERRSAITRAVRLLGRIGVRGERAASLVAPRTSLSWAAVFPWLTSRE